MRITDHGIILQNIVCHCIHSAHFLSVCFCGRYIYDVSKERIAGFGRCLGRQQRLKLWNKRPQSPSFNQSQSDPRIYKIE